MSGSPTGTRTNLLSPSLTIIGTTLLVLPIILDYPWQWSIIIGASGLTLGAISILVYVRRLLFAAASAPHAAFFAASIAILLSYMIGGPPIAWTIVIGLILIYGLGYMAYKGMDADDAAALLVSFSTSAGVISAVYVLTRYSYGPGIISIIMGDPLLSTKQDLIFSIVISLFSVITAFLAAREIAYIGLDKDDAALSGLKLWFYDIVLYTLLGVSVMGLVRIVGFVIEHVLLLLPGAIAVMLGRSGYESIFLSISVTLFSSGLGLFVSVLLNLSPSGVIGLVTVMIYLFLIITKR